MNDEWLGWGTDEKRVIWILGHRNVEQRKKIRDAYQQLYNKLLIDALKSELSGHFGVCISYTIFFNFAFAYSNYMLRRNESMDRYLYA